MKLPAKKTEAVRDGPAEVLGRVRGSLRNVCAMGARWVLGWVRDGTAKPFLKRAKVLGRVRDGCEKVLGRVRDGCEKPFLNALKGCAMGRVNSTNFFGMGARTVF